MLIIINDIEYTLNEKSTRENFISWLETRHVRTDFSDQGVFLSFINACERMSLDSSFFNLFPELKEAIQECLLGPDLVTFLRKDTTLTNLAICFSKEAVKKMLQNFFTRMSNEHNNLLETMGDTDFELYDQISILLGCGVTLMELLKFSSLTTEMGYDDLVIELLKAGVKLIDCLNLKPEVAASTILLIPFRESNNTYLELLAWYKEQGKLKQFMAAYIFIYSNLDEVLASGMTYADLIKTCPYKPYQELIKAHQKTAMLKSRQASNDYPLTPLEVRENDLIEKIKLGEADALFAFFKEDKSLSSIFKVLSEEQLNTIKKNVIQWLFNVPFDQNTFFSEPYQILQASFPLCKIQPFPSRFFLATFPEYESVIRAYLLKKTLPTKAKEVFLYEKEVAAASSSRLFKPIATTPAKWQPPISGAVSSEADDDTDTEDDVSHFSFNGDDEDKAISPCSF